MQNVPFVMSLLMKISISICATESKTYNYSNMCEYSMAQAGRSSGKFTNYVGNTHHTCTCHVHVVD